MAKRKTSAATGRAATVSTPDSRSKLRTTVRDILAAVPTISDAARAAFRSRYDDTYCATLGSRTRGDRVAADAVTWLVAIAGAVTAQPTVLAAYGPPRVRWLAECTDALLQALDAQDAVQGATADNHTASSEARTRALDARDALVTTLDVMAGRHGRDSAALSAVHGTTGTYAALIESLGALADLATAWLGRTDEGSRQLAMASGLTQAMIDEAHAAITAMDDAGAVATAAGHARSHDVPAVNIAEGRVLAELLTARNVFDTARVRVPTVPALVPGVGTRAILTRGRGHITKATTSLPVPTPGAVPAAGAPATGVPAAGVPAAGVNPPGSAPMTPAQQAAYQGPAPMTPAQQAAFQGPAPLTPAQQAALQPSAPVPPTPKRTTRKQGTARGAPATTRRRPRPAPKVPAAPRPRKVPVAPKAPAAPRPKKGTTPKG